MGAMAYVPGSHKAGRLKVVDITHTTEPYEILDDPAIGGTQPVWVEAPAGSVIWHHGLTVHQAAPNTRTETRRVFTVVYLAAGYRRMREWAAYPLDRAGVRAGELMQGAGLPVAWPRGETDPFPEPPAHVGVPTGPQYDVQQD
jgi:ectoine hydroxylase-related dioxygenase (phytanoyl-CoA dioxygenase family)